MRDDYTAASLTGACLESPGGSGGGESLAASVMSKAFAVANGVLQGAHTPEVARAYAAGVSAGARVAQNADRIDALANQASAAAARRRLLQDRKVALEKELGQICAAEVRDSAA